MRRSLIMTLLITAACLVMSTGCQRAASAVRAETDLIPIQVRTPAVVERQDSVTASGSVEGSETTDVAFQVSGKVARVFVDEGQHVNRGQLLAEIESTDYRNAFDAANAHRQMAEALAHLAPGREHDDLDVIEDGQRLDRPLAAPRGGILIGDPELLLLADGAAEGFAVLLAVGDGLGATDRKSVV